MATSTNYTSMAYVAETVEGEAPATPQFQLLPTTGGSPVANITTARSDVIRSDRQTDDLTVVDADVSGDINYELSYAPYKPLIEAVLQNTVTGSISEASCSVDGIDFTVISKAGIEGNVSVGDVFRATSALDSAIDNFYTCIDNSVADEITIYPAMADTMTAQSDVEITATNIIDNGATAPDSYTFRKTAVEGGTPYYWYYHGCRINSMSFNFSTGSILNGTLGVVGRTEDPRATKLTGEQTDLPIPAYSIMNSVNSVGTIYIEGVNLGTCSFSSLDLSIDNQTASAKSVGTLGACDTASFSLNITGSVEVYFKDLSLYNKFKNASEFSVTIILDDDASATLGNGIGINIPKCKFESLDTPIDGKDSFLMQSGSLVGLRDETNNNMIKFSFIDEV